MRTPDHGSPLLHSKIEIPAELRLQTEVEGRPLDFGGDLRIGDLRGRGTADFLVYRYFEGAHDGGRMKPCFPGAFSNDGQVLWRIGADGEQPARPGPVAQRTTLATRFMTVGRSWMAIDFPPDS